MNDISILIKAALHRDDPGEMYRKFCYAVENAVKCTYSGEPFLYVDETSENPYLIRNVALSFASKLYAVEYCAGQRKNKEGALSDVFD